MEEGEGVLQPRWALLVSSGCLDWDVVLAAVEGPMYSSLYGC